MSEQNKLQAQNEFWQAARHGLPWFRFLRRSIKPAVLDQQLQSPTLIAEWQTLRSQMQPGDKIWPFEFHVRSYLGLRRGYLVMRKGQPLGGVITVVS
jgi:hypothetical protein